MSMTTEEILKQALNCYALNSPQADQIRHNENMTYKVVSDDKAYALRIHKPVEGFSLSVFEVSDRLLFISSELDIIADLDFASDLDVQAPVRGRNGSFVQMISDGTPVSLLEWVDGNTVEDTPQTPETLRAVGKLAAKMHLFFGDKPFADKKYHRYSYDQPLLAPIAEKIHAATQRGVIANPQRQVILSALEEMHKRFDELDKSHRKILVHADLSKSNMIVTPCGAVAPIDFSLSGYSHFYMDIGGLFGHIINPKDRQYIIEGYKSVRNCDISSRYLEPYFTLQVIMFIACQYERAAEWEWYGDALNRWCKDIFKPLAEDKTFLD